MRANWYSLACITDKKTKSYSEWSAEQRRKGISGWIDSTNAQQMERREHQVGWSGGWRGGEHLQPEEGGWGWVQALGSFWKIRLVILCGQVEAWDMGWEEGAVRRQLPQCRQSCNTGGWEERQGGWCQRGESGNHRSWWLMAVRVRKRRGKGDPRFHTWVSSQQRLHLQKSGSQEDTWIKHSVDILPNGTAFLSGIFPPFQLRKEWEYAVAEASSSFQATDSSYRLRQIVSLPWSLVSSFVN